jgi:hypothetical protein
VTVIDYDRVGGNEPIGEKNTFFVCLVMNFYSLTRDSGLSHEIRWAFLATNI